MRVDILIHESTIFSCVAELVRRGENPTLKRTKELIKEMVTANGESFVVEPMFTDESRHIVDDEIAYMQASKIAPLYYDKIF